MLTANDARKLVAENLTKNMKHEVEQLHTMLRIKIGVATMNTTTLKLPMNTNETVVAEFIKDITKSGYKAYSTREYDNTTGQGYLMVYIDWEDEEHWEAA